MSDRRYDNSMQGLLRFALEHTKSEDAKNVSNFEDMDEERKRFLEEAFNSMTIDIKEEFQKAISILIDDSTSTNQKLEALNVIRDLIDNIDFANNFAKINGTHILIKHLEGENNEIRVLVQYIIAEMAQNNPFCQKHFLDEGILPTLFSAIDNADKDVASSAIHAISALIRNFDPGLVEFIKMSGLEKLVKSLQTNHQKIFLKSCFLIASLSIQNSYVRDKFVRCNAIDKLTNSMEPVFEYDVKMDSVLCALSALSKSPICKDEVSAETKKTIEKLLREIIDRNKELPECEEMVTNSNTIIENFR